MSDEGLCRVGWAAASSALDIGTDKCGDEGQGGTSCLMPLTWGTPPTPPLLPRCPLPHRRQSFGYGGTGKKSHARQFDDYGQVGWVEQGRWGIE